MGIIGAVLLALALCVDSLVVSATTAFHSRMSWRQSVLMAVVFGVCQGFFPLLGALIGDVARSFIEAVDHWVAFGLLALVGGKMIVDGIRGGKDEQEAGAATVGIGTMFMLGIATSIDAFAVGIGLGLQNPMSTVLWIVALIGVVTLLVSLLGCFLGKQKVAVPERTATILAGVVLIGLGVKILLEHLM